MTEPERQDMDEREQRVRMAARWLGERERRHKRLVRVSISFVGAFLVGCAAVGGCLAQVTPATTPVVLAPGEPVETWATDGDGDAGVIARPMPAAPFKAQRTPPCPESDDVVIAGGCWAPVKHKPDRGGSCGTRYFEHGGECYLPVQQAQRPPTSVEP
jgi:hypothetical protein